MALNVQFIISENRILGEKIVIPRLVNQQSLDYDSFCDYLSQGSTITPGDVSAVMRQIEKMLPTILELNAKVVASPEGLTFRPSIKGSLSQSQLKAKLVAKKEALLSAGDTEGAAKIDVDRAIEAGDLATSDLQAVITIEIPKKWQSRFQQSATFKRVVKASAAEEDSETDDTPTDDGTTNTFTITAVANDASYGTVTGGGSYTSGSRVNLVATANDGYEFSQWDDGDTNATRSITVTEDKTYTATFVADSVDTEGGESGS